MSFKKENVSDDFTCIKVDYGFDSSGHSILIQDKSNYSDDKFDGSAAISDTQAFTRVYLFVNNNYKN
nr:MAG: hypothetical protein [Bacteriophage sp.]